MTLSAFSREDATDIVVMPLVMDRNNGYYTSINLMNVGTSGTNVNCTFTNTTYSFSEYLDPGEGFTKLQKDEIAAGYTGSATCTATDSGGKIVAIVNQLGDNNSVDQLLVYEGINR